MIIEIKCNIIQFAPQEHIFTIIILMTSRESFDRVNMVTIKEYPNKGIEDIQKDTS